MPSLTSLLLASPKPQSSARDPPTAIRVNLLIESGNNLAWKTPLEVSGPPSCPDWVMAKPEQDAHPGYHHPPTPLLSAPQMPQFTGNNFFLMSSRNFPTATCTVLLALSPGTSEKCLPFSPL